MTFTKPDYTLINHTADLGITVYGGTLESLFQNAALSLTHLMVRPPFHGVEETLSISTGGEDLSDLMVRWLAEILYLFEGEWKIVTGVRIESLSSTRIHASVAAVLFDPDLYEILREIKAVTYYQIRVSQKGDHWEANVIFDL